MHRGCEALTKIKERIQKYKEVENSKKYIKTNWMKLAYSIEWFMEILRISLEEQLLMKYYLIKHLILPRCKHGLWFTIFW